MNDCLFCSIAHGDKEKLLWQNDVAVAFSDIHPKAPTHVLVVPKRHIENLDALDDPAFAGELLLSVRAAAHAMGLKGRYRLALNNGRPAGQIIDHLHFHILGDIKAPKLVVKGSEFDQI